MAGSVGENQITEVANAFWITVRSDAADGDVRDDLRQDLEFRGALLAIKQPVHVSVLYQVQQRIFPAKHSNERRILASARPQQINGGKGTALLLKAGQITVERQIAFFPVRCQKGQRILAPDETANAVGPEADAWMA